MSRLLWCMVTGLVLLSSCVAHHQPALRPRAATLPLPCVPETLESRLAGAMVQAVEPVITPQVLMTRVVVQDTMARPIWLYYLDGVLVGIDAAPDDAAAPLWYRQRPETPCRWARDGQEVEWRKRKENSMAEVVTVPRVYLTDVSLNRRSAHHTIYTGDGDPRDPNNVRLQVTVFEFGIATHMPQHIYDQLHALGHVTTDRPRPAEETTL